MLVGTIKGLEVWIA